MLSVFTATLLLEQNFRPFAELPAQQQSALSHVLQAVLSDEELLRALEQVVRAGSSQASVPPRVAEVDRLDLLG